MRRTEIEREEDCARNDSRRETQGKRERAPALDTLRLEVSLGGMRDLQP